MIWLGAALAGQASGASVQLTWEVRDGVVHGVARSTGPGWIAIGFNDRPMLAGSVLLMAAEGRATEEHVAHPPNHPERRLEGVPGLLSSSVQREQGTLVFRFSWRIDTGDGLLPALEPQHPVHLTLAWSRERDFGQHSAERTLVSTVL